MISSRPLIGPPSLPQKLGNLETRKFGNLVIWKLRNLESWKLGNSENLFLLEAQKKLKCKKRNGPPPKKSGPHQKKFLDPQNKN